MKRRNFLKVMAGAVALPILPMEVKSEIVTEQCERIRICSDGTVIFREGDSIFIHSSNNVGIGTPPITELHITDNSNTTFRINNESL